MWKEDETIAKHVGFLGNGKDVLVSFRRHVVKGAISDNSICFRFKLARGDVAN